MKQFFIRLVITVAHVVTIAVIFLFLFVAYTVGIPVTPGRLAPYATLPAGVKVPVPKFKVSYPKRKW